MLTKRAAMPSTVVFILLTLVLIISTLAVFQINMTGLSVNFQTTEALEEVYVRENVLKYQIFIVGNDLLAEDNLDEDSFKEEFSKIKVGENEDLERLKERIANEEFILVGDKFFLQEDFPLVKSTEGIYIYYLSNLEVEFIDYNSRIISGLDQNLNFDPNLLPA